MLSYGKFKNYIVSYQIILECKKMGHYNHVLRAAKWTKDFPEKTMCKVVRESQLASMQSHLFSRGLTFGMKMSVRASVSIVWMDNQSLSMPRCNDRMSSEGKLRIYFMSSIVKFILVLSTLDSKHCGVRPLHLIARLPKNSRTTSG